LLNESGYKPVTFCSLFRILEEKPMAKNVEESMPAPFEWMI